MSRISDAPVDAAAQAALDESAALDERHDIEGRIVRSSGWVALGYGVRNVLTMLSTLVLARILVPHDFGVVALASTLVLVLEHVQASGLAAAVVYQRRDVERTAATAFVFTSVAGLALGAINYLAAPTVARLFHIPEASHVIQVMSLLFVIHGFATGPGAILERNLDFRARAQAELAAGVTQVVVSIGLAFAGAGVWSLVFGQLGAAVVQTAAFWLLVSWRPALGQASWAVLRDMLRYGRYVSASGILGLINGTIDNMFIGRLLGARALGIYAVAFRVADFPTGVVGHVVGRVMFPAYSTMQDNLGAIQRAFVQNVQRVALFVLPLGVTLGLAAHPIVLGLLGEEWLAAVTPLRVLAVYTVIRGFASCAGPLFQALGRPQLVLLWMFPHILVVVPGLILLTPHFGLTGAAVAMLVGFSASGIPAFIHALRLMGLKAAYLAQELSRAFACSVILSAALLLILAATNDMSNIATLILIGATGVTTYVAAAATLARTTWAPIWLSFRGSR